VLASARVGGRVRKRDAACSGLGPYDDDSAWRVAVIMTGVRDDPDFPKISSLEARGA
jgi:hypothetical protein